MARLIPLIRVTLMLPASATRPEAFIMALVDATWPLLIPIETVAPPPQALLVEAIWTFHSPSKVAAAAGVAIGHAREQQDAGGDNRFAKLSHDVPLLLDAGRVTRLRRRM